MRRYRGLTFMTVVLLTAACGADDGDPDPAVDDVTAAEPETTDDPDPEPEATDDPAAEPEATDEPAVDAEDGQEGATDGDVAVASSDLGEILVDRDGMTLYLFTNDSEGTSVCVDDCAVAWPPLIVDGEPAAGEGADGSLLGTTVRDDGSEQVTYAGWPLYTWAQDQQPGDVTGQGVQDVWFVVSPDGEAIMDAEEEATRADGY